MSLLNLMSGSNPEFLDIDTIWVKPTGTPRTVTNVDNTGDNYIITFDDNSVVSVEVTP